MKSSLSVSATRRRFPTSLPPWYTSRAGRAVSSCERGGGGGGRKGEEERGGRRGEEEEEEEEKEGESEGRDLD